MENQYTKCSKCGILTFRNRDSSGDILCGVCIKKLKKCEEKDLETKPLINVHSDTTTSSKLSNTFTEKTIFDWIKRNKKLSNILGGVILCLAYLYFFDNKPTTSKNQYQDEITTAFIISKEIVKTKLKAPATAEFPFVDFKYSSLGQNTYSITSYVDAQNSYGALLRNDWCVRLKYLGGDKNDINNWEVLGIEINPR